MRIMRILAIDDEPILLKMIEASLKRICTEKDEITVVKSIKELLRRILQPRQP